MALATRPKPKTHAKKRQAQHHRHSKHYLKSYWPYLPMLLIVGLGLMVNSAWSKSSVLGAKSDFSAGSLLDDTNVERAKDNEPALALNPQLAAAAQAKAEDMVKADYWAHNSPEGKTPWSFINASGYQYQTAGENLAYGFSSAGDSVAGWMNSPEHRANILDNTYRDVGFGVASSPNYQGQGPETVVVAEYGQPATAANPVAATQASNVLGASSEIAAQPVSRVQVLAGSQAAWSLLAVIVLTTAAMALFTLRHGYRLHRLLTRGEIFVVHHPYFDIAIVFVITAGIILTRTSGIIR
jgi:hypothetical protein